MDSEPRPGGFDGEHIEDVVYLALGDRTRRDALRVLATSGTPLSVDRLATEVGAHDAGGVAAGGERTTATVLSLTHVHLPKLADAGLVAVDPETRRVTLTDLGAQLTLLAPDTGSVGATLPIRRAAD